METNNKTAPVTWQQDQNTISLDLMNRMKLHGMAEAFRESLAGTTPQTMTADTFLSMLLAREWDYRAQATIARLTRNAASRYKAYLEQINYATNRGWTATRWNASQPLISCIRDKIFSSPALPVRGKAIWPAPLDMRHAKGGTGHSMPMPLSCSVH